MTDFPPPGEPTPVPYATPAPRGPRTAPGAVCMITGLGLIALGGCFLIGVLISNESHHAMSGSGAARLSASEVLFQGILYVVTLFCFAGAIYMIRLGIDWLQKG